MLDQEKIHNQCLGKDTEERIKALDQINEIFSLLSDKRQAWNDLIILASDQNIDVKRNAVSALASIFSQMPDKQWAWNELHQLTNDQNSDVRKGTAYALGAVFSQVPDKQQAWEDLHKFTTGEDIKVRRGATYALSLVFSHVPNKQQAWNDLHSLSSDKDHDVRLRAAYAIGSVFSHIPNKQQAWNDLIILATDRNINVRRFACFSFGSVFSQLLDKQQQDLTWNCLIELSNDQDIGVKAYANHALGNISLFRASQAEKEEDYKRELENAIEFFEKAVNNGPFEWENPAQFYLPFYRSFYAIVFERPEAKKEVYKYLAEAKSAIEGSMSKELLFKAVENLAEALKKVQNLENLDLEAKKGELNFYRKYCDRAVELMREAERTVPSATQADNLERLDCGRKKSELNLDRSYSDYVDDLLRDTKEARPFVIEAMKKGLPILNRNLKSIIEEIQKKSEVAYKQTKGTDTEEIVCSINKEVQKWEIGSQEEMKKTLEKLLNDLELMIPETPENKPVLDNIKEVRNEKDLVLQYEILLKIIQSIPFLKTKQDIETEKINDSTYILKFNIPIGLSLGVLGFISYFIYSNSEANGLTFVNSTSLIISLFLVLLSLILSVLRRH